MPARLLAAALLLASTLMAPPAAAQVWSFVTDPSDQSGMAIHTDGKRPIISLHCLREGFDAEAFRAASGTDVLPRPNRPGEAIVTVYGVEAPMGRAAPDEEAPARLVLRVDRERFPLRGARLERATGNVRAAIPLNGPAVDALRGGNRLRIVLREADLRLRVSLRGSDKALASLQAYCASPLPRATTPPADAPTRPSKPRRDETATAPAAPAAPAAPQATDAPLDPVEAAIARDFPGDIEQAAWFDNPSDPSEALAFVYQPVSGGNSVTLTVALYRMAGSEWRQAGVVRDLFGADPREAEFGPDSISVTTTTPKPGDARCCPTGETRWTIDRATLKAQAQ